MVYLFILATGLALPLNVASILMMFLMPGFRAFAGPVVLALSLFNFGLGLLVAFLTLKLEARKIRPMLRGIVLYPIFLLTMMFIALGALFRPCTEWIPIEHQSKYRIEDGYRLIPGIQGGREILAAVLIKLNGFKNKKGLFEREESMATFDEIYRRLLSKAAQGGKIEERECDMDDLNCLLHPGAYPLVWKVGACDCPPERRRECGRMNSARSGRTAKMELKSIRKSASAAVPA